MKGLALHEDAVVFDGLIVSNWSREVFEDMHRGGLTAANCTCSVWEGFHDTMINVGQWNRWFQDHGDLIVKARTTAVGFQNTSAFEDRLDFIQIFKDAGVGVAQITYNTQNLAGSGCYESTDSGLSDFGHEVVAEMNRVGMLCDLSHVGSVTSRDVIEASGKPVAYTHCLPAGLKEHPRNKADDELRFIADHGGFIGVTMFTPFLRRGGEASIDDYIEAIDYIINIAGEDRIGIGTDFTQGHGDPFFKWISQDKGYARTLSEFGEIKFPDGFSTIGDFPNLTAKMERAGWTETRIRNILGLNWMRLLDEVWGP